MTDSLDSGGDSVTLVKDAVSTRRIRRENMQLSISMDESSLPERLDELDYPSYSHGLERNHQHPY